MNDSSTIVSFGAAEAPVWTTGTLAAIAIFGVIVVIGIVVGMRMKAKRQASQADLIARNETFRADEATPNTEADAQPAVPPEPAPISAAPAAPAPPPAPAAARSAPVSPTPAAPPPTDSHLTRLKGLGPKVAARLSELGITNIAQLAALSDDQATALDAQLGAFQGRLTRDRWLEQARLLTAGDTAGYEAEFGRLG